MSYFKTRRLEAMYLEATYLKAPKLEVVLYLEATYLEVLPYLEATYLEVAPCVEATYLKAAPHLEAPCGTPSSLVPINKGKAVSPAYFAAQPPKTHAEARELPDGIFSQFVEWGALK